MGIYQHSFTNNELKIYNAVLKFLVHFVSELVKVNPNNSLTEWVNL